MAHHITGGREYPTTTNATTSGTTNRTTTIQHPQVLLDYHRRLCVGKEEVIGYDDFENRKAVGWTGPGSRVMQLGGFGMALGKLGHGARPRKTYTIRNKDVPMIRVEADFYEIDNWAGSHKFWGRDFVNFFINGQIMKLGFFSRNINEEMREGTTKGGIRWFVYSIDPPEHICCAVTAVDQRHRIVAYVPRSVYQRSGKLNLRFRIHLQRLKKIPVTSTELSKAAAFDNIKLFAQSCASTSVVKPPSAVPTKVIVQNKNKRPTRRQSSVFGTKTCQRHKHEVVSFENFEDKTPVGWRNAKIDSGGSLTNFLGRFGRGDARPAKTFRIPTRAQEVHIQFDFYEIDRWMGNNNRRRKQGDFVCVFVNNIKINLGVFWHWVDEKNRQGAVSGGIKWHMRSVTKPVHHGFNPRIKDQKHRIIISVPKAIYKKLGNKINLKFWFATKGVRGVKTKSAGIDNVQIAIKTCAGTSSLSAPSNRPPPLHPLAKCATKDHVVSFEDFENGYTTGWLPGFSEYRKEFSRFLGRYTKGTALTTRKTYSLPKGTRHVKMSFDFYEIDSWDSRFAPFGPDSLTFKVNDNAVHLGFFGSLKDEGTRRGTSKSGIRYTMTSLTKPDYLAFNPQFLDQKHRIVADIPRKLFGSTDKIKLQFKVSINSKGTWDESAGFDNIKIVATICKNARLPTPSSRVRRRPTIPPRPKTPSSNSDRFARPTNVMPSPKMWFVGKGHLDFETSMERTLSYTLTKELRAEWGGRNKCLYGVNPKVFVNLIERSDTQDASSMCSAFEDNQ